MTKSRKLRRSFTPEFKEEAVRLLGERQAVGMPVSHVARELGIRPGQLREWAKERAAEVNGRPRAGETPDQELRRLRRENAILRQEADFAKKVAVYFAKESL
jgi:transposase